MFRVASGFKTKYHYLTLLVASDFDEWKIVIHGPGVCIHGGRQFTEAKAKDHARACATSYIHEEKKEELPQLAELDWQPLAPGEWLNWRP
jgi:hypothetical protein